MTPPPLFHLKDKLGQSHVSALMFTMPKAEGPQKQEVEQDQPTGESGSSNFLLELLKLFIKMLMGFDLEKGEKPAVEEPAKVVVFLQQHTAEQMRQKRTEAAQVTVMDNPTDAVRKRKDLTKEPYIDVEATPVETDAPAQDMKPKNGEIPKEKTSGSPIQRSPQKLLPLKAGLGEFNSPDNPITASPSKGFGKILNEVAKFRPRRSGIRINQMA